MQNIQATLEENGFSSSESKVYLTLLKIGQTRAGQIIKQTSLQSSVVYNALNTLTDKGFIAHIIKGKIKHYHTLDPKIINKYIEIKQQNFLKILPSLNQLQQTSTTNPTNVEICEGYKGLFNATLKLIENAKKGQIYKYFAISESILEEEAIEFFNKIDDLKEEKGLIVRGIANMNCKLKFKKLKNSKVKYTNQNIPPAMNIFEDKIILTTFSDKPISILIESKEIAQQYHNLWDEIWKKSK